MNESLSFAKLSTKNDISISLFQNKNAEPEEDPLAKLKSQKLVSCRICKGDHWTTKCPYKDTLGPIQVNFVVVLSIAM